MGVTSSKKENASPSEYGQIFIQSDKTACVSGESISGKICLNTLVRYPPSKLFLKIEGIEGVYLREGTSLKEKKKVIINSAWCLLIWDKGLSPGQREVPFTFRIPPDLPASFYQEGSSFLAHIAYKLEVSLKPDQSLDIPQIICQQKLVIRNPIPETHQGHSKTVETPLTTLCCIPRGSLCFEVQFEKDLYSIREEVQAVLKIDSSKAKLNNSRVFLDLVQVLTVNTYGSSRIYKSVRSRATDEGALAQNGPTVRTLKLNIPLFAGDDHDLYTRESFRPKGASDQYFEGLSATTQGTFITSEYFLHAYCEMQGDWTTSAPIIKYPINIVYPNPEPQILDLPDEWNPKVLSKFDIGFAKTTNKATEGKDDNVPMLEPDMIQINVAAPPEPIVQALEGTKQIRIGSSLKPEP